MILTPTFYEAYIRQDQIPFVTSADKHSKEGLFSSEIFGVTEKDKLFKYAFINLKCKVMSGGMLDMFKRIDSNFVHCCLYPTQKQYKIVNGRLQEASSNDVNTGSGSEWLYDHWDELDMRVYQSSGSKYANKEMKKALLKYSRDEYFTSYQYVMPVLYRDESSEPGAILYNEFNIVYAELIRYSNLLDISQAQTKEFGVTIARLDTVAKIQAKVLELHDIITDKTDGSKGMGKKLGLSRAVDHSARMTIIPAIYHKRKFGHGKMSVTRIGVPLFHLIAMFTPFTIKFSHDFIDELYNKGYFGDLTISAIKPFYDKEHLEEIIEKMEDPSFRIEPFETPDQGNGKNYIEMQFNVLDKKTKNIKPITKKLTNIEFFYIVLNTYLRITETKYVMTTRYPVDSMLSIQPMRPVVMTLNPRLVKEVSVLDREYDDFPFIGDEIVNNFAEKIFETCSRITSSTAVGFNGDFDRYLSVLSRNGGYDSFIKSW